MNGILTLVDEGFFLFISLDNKSDEEINIVKEALNISDEY